MHDAHAEAGEGERSSKFVLSVGGGGRGTYLAPLFASGKSPGASVSPLEMRDDPEAWPERPAVSRDRQSAPGAQGHPGRSVLLVGLGPVHGVRLPTPLSDQEELAVKCGQGKVPALAEPWAPLPPPPPPRVCLQPASSRCSC